MYAFIYVIIDFYCLPITSVTDFLVILFIITASMCWQVF